jgi:hypothetical protein
MSDVLREAFENELLAASAAERVADYDRGFYHLERAHIIGQRFTARHMRVHWLMLKYGLVLRRPQEVLGQLARIVAAALFSRIWVPIGNTGRASVSAMRPMPIPDDLRRLLEDHGA